jgi:hypothetical protein
MPDSHATYEPHPWADKTPEQVLEALVYELYTPVSALGDEVDRLSSGAFEDEELTNLLEQIRASVNHLSRLVVAIKRYTAERAAGEPLAG